LDDEDKLLTDFVSYLFESWLNPILSSGSKRVLTESDFSRTISYEESKYLTDELEMYVLTNCNNAKHKRGKN
jgi:hypothetical protein